MINQFGEEKIINVKNLTPTHDDFPFQLDGSKQMVHSILSILAVQMDLDHNNIRLDFYNQQLLEIRNDFGFTLHGKQYEDENYSSGLYIGKNKNKFLIAVEQGQLKNPDRVVATLAHELAHIKILGEGRLKENDEYLTDPVTVFFGIGIFNWI